MHSPSLMRLATLLLLTSFVSGCASGDLRSKLAINLPPPPKFMGACDPSDVKVGEKMTNGVFDREHAAFKQCSRRGSASLAWYVGVRKRFGSAKLK